jgi:hypothetical protein
VTLNFRLQYLQYLRSSSSGEHAGHSGVLWGRDEGTRGEALWPTGVPPLQTKGALSLPTNIDRHRCPGRAYWRYRLDAY